MAPADYNEFSTLKYSFVNGVYQATDFTVGSSFSYSAVLSAIPFPGDVVGKLIGGVWGGVSGTQSNNGSITPAEALAVMVQGNVNEQPTLAVAFRGWSEWADTAIETTDTRQFSALYTPLITALQTYLSQSDNTFKQVLLTGMDLGGSAMQWAMQQLSLPGIKIQGYTFGSLGAEVGGANQNIENFELSTDPYYVLSQQVASPVANFLLGNGLSAGAGVATALIPQVAFGVAARFIVGSILNNVAPHSPFRRFSAKVPSKCSSYYRRGHRKCWVFVRETDRNSGLPQRSSLQCGHRKDHGVCSRREQPICFQHACTRSSGRNVGPGHCRGRCRDPVRWHC